ncbi:MAG: hypothetical protein KGL69_05385 [Alphaproteobacteria bacterium]|nr:hypothetical protein [Alphaproteobacteria bacterium]
MDIGDSAAPDITWLNAAARAAFRNIETLAYAVLGLMLALAVVVGILGAAASLWDAVLSRGEAAPLVAAVDRLLFVLMVVEILHTVRVSFRSGTLVCEPFLIVGLIASVRRVLVITLEASQAHPPGGWNAEAQGLIDATMRELLVLGGLILIMVVSIFILRRSTRGPEEV